MWKLLCLVAVLVLPTAAAAQEHPATTGAPAPIEVMILGTYHMANPGQDVHNARIDPVTTPEKQAQLAAVAEGLARFRPTAIAVERVARDSATMLDHGYPAFTPADLLTRPNERTQIAYRLADDLGLTRVYAIDEQEREGQPSYFPYQEVMTWAAENGRGEALAAMNAEVGEMMQDLEQRQRTRTVGQLLAAMNAPERVGQDQAFYTRLLAFGAGDAQPGAVLNGRWFTRNAVIFANLVQVARPGDRIIVVYGAGHNFWLRHLVETTPGFRLVEATDYLPAQ